jgi:hypothetical protein
MGVQNDKALKRIQDLKLKIGQAASDKLELMRDLATYDVNFSDSSGIRSTLLRIHNKV